MKHTPKNTSPKIVRGGYNKQVKIPGLTVNKTGMSTKASNILAKATKINAKANLAASRRGGVAKQIGSGVAEVTSSVMVPKTIGQTIEAGQVSQYNKNTRSTKNDDSFLNKLISGISGQPENANSTGEDGNEQSNSIGNSIGGG